MQNIKTPKLELNHSEPSECSRHCDVVHNIVISYIYFLNTRFHLDLSDWKKFFINHGSVVNVSNMNEDFVQYVFSVVFCILVA